jgi:hypothetical protein
MHSYYHVDESTKFFRKSSDSHQTTRRYIPEDGNLHGQFCDKIKSEYNYFLTMPNQNHAEEYSTRARLTLSRVF